MSLNSQLGSKPSMATVLKQTQKLIMSPQMQQAIKLLQVPTMELSSIIELEMELNPLLEYASEIDQDDEDRNEDFHGCSTRWMRAPRARSFWSIFS